jgi:hypothetical protein
VHRFAAVSERLRRDTWGREMKPVGLESIGRLVDDSRAGKSSMHPWQEEVIVALADENDRLRAERDEAVKLLDSDDVGDQCSWFMERPQGECGWGTNNTCWSHRKKALLAKLRTP